MLVSLSSTCHFFVLSASILKSNDFSKWFSAIFMPDGEVQTVIFPKREEFYTILFKKTLIGYLSSKFKGSQEVREFC